jgi:rRNA maturation RNase YbeY
MLKIEFNNRSRSPVGKNILKKITEKTIEKSGISGLKKKNISLSFASVSEEEMRKLNKTYRRENKLTDVLAFAEFRNQKEIKRALQCRDAQPGRLKKDKDVRIGRLCKNKNKNTADLFLGEIVLCYNDIAGYSKKNKLDTKREFRKVAAHGVLHLLGFRHGKKMFEVQKKI